MWASSQLTENRPTGYDVCMCKVRLRIKEVAAQKGISQRRLAKLSGVDLRHIQRLFHHPEMSVTTNLLGKLAQALEVDVSELIESVPDDPPEETPD
jgi:DNA-binding Xre family transcriptional regulator